MTNSEVFWTCYFRR